MEHSGRALHPYLEVLRLRQARALLAAALVGKLSFAMGPLALVLFVQHATGSFTLAGGAAAATTLTSGLLAPLRGRLIDRHGQRLLLPFAATYAAAFAAMLPLAGRGSAGAALAIVLAGVAGAAAPPLSASMRVLWVELVGNGPRLQTAYALDSVLEEVLYTAGPLLAGALALVAPALALCTVAALSLVGTGAFTASPVARGWTGRQSEQVGWAGAIGEPGIRVVVASLSGFGATLGVLTIALVAAAKAHGPAATGGVLLGLISVGSAVGGFWYGSRTWRSATGQRFPWLLGLAALACAPMPFLPSLLALGAAAAAFGLLLSPLLSSAYLLATELAPPGSMTEAATWVTTASNVTAAGGTALAGILVDHAGVHWTLGAACACSAMGFLVALAGRATLLRDRAATATAPGEPR